MNSENRPYIICHMMISIDGKITYGTIDGKKVDQLPFDVFFDLYVSSESSFNPKAILCGRVTMEAFAEGQNTELKDGFSETEEENMVLNSAGDYFIGIDSKGSLRWKNNQITVKTGADMKDRVCNLIILVTQQTPKKYLFYLKSKNISFLTCGETDIDFRLAFNLLKSKFGIWKIILEGGGITNGLAISSGLIDEISILILPFVVNNMDTNSVFDKKLSQFELYNFKLESVEKLPRGVVWLKYKR